MKTQQVRSKSSNTQYVLLLFLRACLFQGRLWLAQTESSVGGGALHNVAPTRMS